MEFWIGYFLVVLLYACVCGAFTSRVAREKGYSGSWYWAGFWFGLVALIAACGLPDRQEEGRQTEATRKTLGAEILAQREQANVESHRKSFFDKMVVWFLFSEPGGDDGEAAPKD